MKKRKAPKYVSPYYTSDVRQRGIEQLQKAGLDARDAEGDCIRACPKVSELIQEDLLRAQRLETLLGVTVVDSMVELPPSSGPTFYA